MSVDVKARGKARCVRPLTVSPTIRAEVGDVVEYSMTPFETQVRFSGGDVFTFDTDFFDEYFDAEEL